MEIKITEFFNNEHPRDFQASVMEIGNNAGQATWAAAMESAEDDYQYITADNREEFESHVLDFGAWEEEEVNTWTLQECNALFIQMVSGDMREYCDDSAEWSWAEYEELCQEGQCRGCLFKGDDNEIYYYIGM